MTHMHHPMRAELVEINQSGESMYNINSGALWKHAHFSLSFFKLVAPPCSSNMYGILVSFDSFSITFRVYKCCRVYKRRVFNKDFRDEALIVGEKYSFEMEPPANVNHLPKLTALKLEDFEQCSCCRLCYPQSVAQAQCDCYFQR